MLDDPSSALDVDTEEALWHRILEDRVSADHCLTCLVVSNRPAVLSRADQVLYMKDGRVVERSGYSEAGHVPG